MIRRPTWIALATSLLLGACGGLEGCSSGSPDSQLPTVEAYVLVDLSETWHNALSRKRNERVLAEIGQGVAAVSETFEPPVAIQHRVIGAGSLGREPICDALFAPTLIPVNADGPDYLITRLDKLKRYVGVDCPALIVRQPPEPLTEISATIASVTSVPPRPGVRRFLVIASDFREETRGGKTMALPDLAGYRILLVYRPLAEDQMAPEDLGQRVEAWRSLLSKRNAIVSTVPDTALKRATIASFLTRR